MVESIIIGVCVIGIFLAGVLLGYSKGLGDNIKEYDKLLDEQRTFYEKELDKYIDEGEEWKRRSL